MAKDYNQTTMTNFLHTLSRIRPLRRSRILDAVGIRLPRPRTLIIAFLLIGGLSVPMLAVLNILPFTFLTNFTGFAVIAAGGVLLMTFCGEI
jgi:hypothetical protein